MWQEAFGVTLRPRDRPEKQPCMSTVLNHSETNCLVESFVLRPVDCVVFGRVQESICTCLPKRLPNNSTALSPTSNGEQAAEHEGGWRNNARHVAQ